MTLYIFKNKKTLSRKSKRIFFIDMKKVGLLIQNLHILCNNDVIIHQRQLKCL